MNYLRLTTVLLILLAPKSYAFVKPTSINIEQQKAQQCTQIIARLERLNCFDRIFNTPVENVDSSDKLKPEAWRRVHESEKVRTENITQAILTKADIDSPDMWLTIPAMDSSSQDLAKGQEQNKKQHTPILMMSCIDNISRLELIFDKPLDSSIIDIGSNSFSTMEWRSDESGYVLSTGRGLLAIRVMKNIISPSELIFHSDLDFVNGLRFDTSNLSEIIAPMRQSCRW